MSHYVHGRTYVCNIHYHIIWCVKYRRKILSDDISTQLVLILQDIAKEHGFSVDDAQVGERDHVHCFVTAPPNLSISNIVRYLKGESSICLFRKYPNVRHRLWRGHLWNSSYFVETIGSTSEENIKNI